jgi:hypothetical protein
MPIPSSKGSPMSRLAAVLSVAALLALTGGKDVLKSHEGERALVWTARVAAKVVHSHHRSTTPAPDASGEQR